MTIDSYLYTAIASGAPSPNTIRNYRAGIAQFLEWCGGRRPEDLEIHDLEEYRAHLVRGLLSRSTINLRLASVRVLYRCLVASGVRQDNPALGLRGPKPELQGAAAVGWRSLPLESASRLYYLIIDQARPCRDRAILGLMLVYGLRVGEVVQIASGDLDLDGKLIVHGKGGRDRVVRILDPILALLRETGPIGLCVRSAEEMVNKYLRELGVKRRGLSCHSLRHTAGMLAALSGSSPVAIQAMLGHADPKTTWHYIQSASQHLKNPAENSLALISTLNKVASIEDHSQKRS